MAAKPKSTGGKNLKIRLKELEIQKEIELQKLKWEAQERQERLAFEKEKFEHEKLLKQRELEAKIELDKEKLKLPTPNLVQNKFDPSRHIKLVPKFQEENVDQFFLHFEKVANNFKWPKESWAVLLQSVLLGKARESLFVLVRRTKYELRYAQNGNSKSV